MSLRARLIHLRPIAIRTIQLLAFAHLFSTDVLEYRECEGFSMLPTLSHSGDRVLVSPIPYWAPWPPLPSLSSLFGRNGGAGDDEMKMGSKIDGSYGRRPKVGDLVVATSLLDPRATVCKRVIGVEGDLVEVEPRRSHSLSTSTPTPAFLKNHAIGSEPGPIGADDIGLLDSREPGDDWRRQTKRRQGEDKFVRVPKGHVWIVGDNLSNSTDSRTYGPVPLAAIRGKVIARVWPNFKWFENNTRPTSNES